MVRLAPTHEERLAMIGPKRPGVWFLLAVAGLACLAAEPPSVPDLFAGQRELSIASLIEEVLAQSQPCTD